MPAVLPACSHAYKRQSRPPTRALRSARPPLVWPLRTRFSSTTCRRTSPPHSSLDLTRARTVACSSALRQCSPDSELRRPRRRSHATATHRSHLRPSYYCQLLPGKPNHSPCHMLVSSSRRTHPRRQGHGC
jgi:hypothetical protein